MKTHSLLSVSGTLSALFFSIHIIQDVRLRIDPIGPQSIGGVAILLLWLVGTLVVPHRRAGQVIALLAGLFAVAMYALHLQSPRITERALADGGFEFIWVMLAMAVTGALSAVLAAYALWAGRRPSAAGVA